MSRAYEDEVKPDGDNKRAQDNQPEDDALGLVVFVQDVGVDCNHVHEQPTNERDDRERR